MPKPSPAPSLTQLKSILRESAFDPRADGPNKVITDVAINNPSYAEERAIELIREAQLALGTGAFGSGGVEGFVAYDNGMARAIGLLALARAARAART